MFRFVLTVPFIFLLSLNFLLLRCRETPSCKVCHLCRYPHLLSFLLPLSFPGPLGAVSTVDPLVLNHSRLSSWGSPYFNVFCVVPLHVLPGVPSHPVSLSLRPTQSSPSPPKYLKWFTEVNEVVLKRTLEKITLLHLFPVLGTNFFVFPSFPEIRVVPVFFSFFSKNFNNKYTLNESSDS